MLDGWLLSSRIKKMFGVQKGRNHRVVNYFTVGLFFLIEKWFRRVFGRKLKYRNWNRMNDVVDEGYSETNRKLSELLKIDLKSRGYPGFSDLCSE